MRREGETASSCSEGREPWVVRESERDFLGVWLSMGPGECVQGCLGHTCARVCGCLGVCLSQSSDACIYLCICGSGLVNMHESVRAGMYLCVARVHIFCVSVEMTVCLRTS